MGIVYVPFSAPPRRRRLGLEHRYAAFVPDSPGYEVGLTVNGEPRNFTVEARTLLVHLLRDACGLTGTKIGCDTSQCGACTVLVDGRAEKSCTLLAVRLPGAAVTTIEGLAEPGELHPVQAAFAEHHGLQCGFCTPGMILTTLDLLSRDPNPDDDAVRHALAGNMCRCTGYHTIVESVQAAAAAQRLAP
jgi:carbon-monoxide dehydrogenase small subunit